MAFSMAEAYFRAGCLGDLRMRSKKACPDGGDVDDELYISKYQILT